MWRKTDDYETSKRNSASQDKERPSNDKKGTLLFHLQNLRSKYSSEKNFEKLCGFRWSDLSSFEKFTALLYRPTDPASLGIVRALFGMCMVLDVVEERGLADIDIKWGDPSECHFPLIHGMRPPTLPWIIVIYSVMWLGAFGIMLGLHFKIACACFAVPYWYIFLLDKSYWNNHTYLYGVVAILFWGTGANKYFALDADKVKQTERTVPLWNYFILRFQFFALYFLAGLKKSDTEWLEGFAMTNLSRHWVFSPFKLFLTSEQTDFLIVHWFAFIFDLTVGFWMLFDKTRIPAMIFCTAFHLMNSRVFNIGMFPYVCLATMPLFCNVDWPRKCLSYFNSNCAPFVIINNQNANGQTKNTRKDESDSILSSDKSDNKPRNDTNENSSIENGQNELAVETDNETKNIETLSKTDENKMIGTYRNVELCVGSSKILRKRKFVVSLLLLHVALQFFLPYSHFLTKGYNNWVPGLYGYSWDMMVHAWDTILVVVKVHDNVSNEDRYLDPNAWVQNDRWEKHGDMMRQYAYCLKNNLIEQEKDIFKNNFQREKRKWTRLSSNLSIYIDVWCSLNGRFQQRMFDPNVDLLAVDWHPFTPISFLMPLLTQYNSYRYKLEKIQQHVYTWSNDTDVLFVADFPGMHLDNFISTNFTNVTLTILEGEVTYSDEKRPNGVTVSKDSSIPIKTGQFHKIKTTSTYPACYMYTYTNPNRQQLELEGLVEPQIPKDPLPIAKEFNYKLRAWWRALCHIANAFFYLVYDVPMVRRIRINK